MYGLTIMDVRKLAFDLAEKVGFVTLSTKTLKCRELIGCSVMILQPQGISVNHAARFNKEVFFSVNRAISRVRISTV